MSDFSDTLKKGWAVMVIVTTLVAAGVGWTSYLQGQIGERLELQRATTEQAYFARSRGELLEQRVQYQQDTMTEIRRDIRALNENMGLILRHLERLEARN